MNGKFKFYDYGKTQCEIEITWTFPYKRNWTKSFETLIDFHDDHFYKKN